MPSIMVWKGYGRKWSQPNCSSIPTFVWRDWGKPWKTYQDSSISANIWSKHLPKTSVECYCYTNHLRFLVVKTKTVQQWFTLWSSVWVVTPVHWYVGANIRGTCDLHLQDRITSTLKMETVSSFNSWWPHIRTFCPYIYFKFCWTKGEGAGIQE